MAAKGYFGTKVPNIFQITRFEGDKLFDADGDEFPQAAVEIVTFLGGDWEIPELNPPRKPRKKSE